MKYRYLTWVKTCTLEDRLQAWKKTRFVSTIDCVPTHYPKLPPLRPPRNRGRKLNSIVFSLRPVRKKEAINAVSSLNERLGVTPILKQEEMRVISSLSLD